MKKPRRKASVVQITKDETSDYNTDEESFSDEHQTCNTTLFHVENRQIKDCFEIQVTKKPINKKTRYMHQTINVKRLNLLVTENTENIGRE